MRSSLLTVVSILVLFACVLGFDVQDALACSGGAPLTIGGFIEGSDYLIKAYVFESDEANQNVIVQVENYLTGGAGPQYLLLKRNDPSLVQYIRVGRSTGGDCLGLFPALTQDQPFYAFIRRNENGSYSPIRTLFNATFYSFPEPDTTVEVFLTGGVRNGDQILENFAERDSGQQVTEREFVEIIADVSGEEPVSPDTSSRYPLKAPVLITTDSGEYILPIDWQEPYSIAEDTFSIRQHPLYAYGFSDAFRCSEAERKTVQISPDNLNIAVVFEDNTICFTWEESVQGQSVTFSTTSDSAAVWDDCTITVYSLGYPRLGQEWFQVREVASQQIEGTTCESSHETTIWNPQGNVLAFASDAGIWLWDIQNVEMNLLIEAGSDFLHPNNFSPLGRYLNYSTDEITQHIDIYTHNTLPNGLFSPDEQLLMKFEGETAIQGYEICSRFAFTECAYRDVMYITLVDETTREVTNVYNPHVIRAAEWVSDSSFVYLSCVKGEDNICGIFRWFPTYYGWDNALVGRGTDYDYDPHTDQFVIVRDENTIVVNRNEIDLSSEITDPIIEVHWLPTIFYYD